MTAKIDRSESCVVYVKCRSRTDAAARYMLDKNEHYLIR